MKYWKKPTPDKVDRAIALIGNSGHYRYFFDRLNNPEWLKLLRAKGFFRNPPKPNLDEEKGTIGFPIWPESRYLARMASQKAETVLEIIVQIPETDNVRIHEDLLDAALAMPPKVSVKLLENAKQWAKLKYSNIILPEKFGDLISHLAKGGEIDASLGLARVVLEILPDPKEKEKEDARYGLPPEPTARFDEWDYRKILNKNIPDLVKAGGIPAFELLCDLLETAIRLSQREKNGKAQSDYSWIWRPAIENHPQNHPHGVKDSLVNSVRDAALAIAQTNKELTSVLIEKLESRPWLIFQRISLHLLRHTKDVTLEMSSKRLTNRSFFDEPGCRHEYALLLDSCFRSLSESNQKIILNWIEGGPDLEKFKKRQEEFTGKRPSHEEAKRYGKCWQRDRLAWFKDNLPEAWKKRYKELVAEVGEPEHSEFASYSASWVGPTSPKTREELQAMSISEIAEFCRSWKPPEERMTPSREGLGRVLASFVAEDPLRFSEAASEFRGLHPTYVRALISGLRDALGKQPSFNWCLVLDLCNWVLSQPSEITGNDLSVADEDPHWGWTRKSIADLLSKGFDAESGGLTYDFRDIVWKIIEPLTEDPDPTPEHEAKYGGSNMDPATLSINTTRGEAMHAAIRYALWIRRNIESQPNAKKRLNQGFNEMPEVRKVLEDHLDTSLEPSLAVRSVYGQWFPWLVLLDQSWAKDHADQVFPFDEAARKFWYASWNTYITFCNAYDGVFDVLRSQYSKAIDRLCEPEMEQRGIANPRERLAQHLMVFYWRGKLDLTDPDGLLSIFWQKASTDVRGKAMEFIGRSLYNDKRIVPSKTLERLRSLWKARLFEAKTAERKDEFTNEMSAFGWWFASGKFDDKWALEQLLEALRITNKLEADRLVVERLTMMSEEMPILTIRCLEYLVKGDKEGWKMYGWREHVKKILSGVLQAGGEAAPMAEEMIHYLGSRGYLEFRVLLERNR